MSDSRLHIAVGVVTDERGRILISERKQDCAYAGQWEFPGGKVESGESVQQALARELYEELGLTVNAERPLISIHHQYPDRRVFLDTWQITDWSGQAESREGQRFIWVNPSALDDFAMLAANRPIVRAVQLPDKYLLTPECGDQHGFLKVLEVSLRQGVRLIRLRQPMLTLEKYEVLARECNLLCRRYGAELMLDHLELSQKMNLGLHLNSQALCQYDKRPVGPEVLLAASCHSSIDLEKAEQIDCDFAVLGPVSATASHPAGCPLGWERFAEMLSVARCPAFALGGMTVDDISIAWKAGGQGIAAIRALWPADLD